MGDMMCYVEKGADETGWVSFRSWNRTLGATAANPVITTRLLVKARRFKRNEVAEADARLEGDGFTARWWFKV